MSTLGSADLQDSSGENLALQSDLLDRRSDLRPFSEELRVDKKLKLSRENFKQSIDDFYKDKNITPLSQLTETPAFPSPHVLAQFASKTYTDYDKEETDAQYETRLALPDGWKLLTTASNGRWNNGYFGAAYWHPEHQQVVIAHRGTKVKNLGSLWTDLFGVLFENHVSQMGSASTFAHKVVEVLREVNRLKGISFQLFFTGHSLGGWLAQITTFSTEYLKGDGNIFLRSIDDNDCYHPHTVVFDSPGCKEMLSKVTDEVDVRYDGRSIDLENLDITSYLSAPNRINTCKKHLGTVYRIFTDLSDMGWWKKRTALYNLSTHSIDKIVQAFDPETGQVHKDEQGQLKVQVVVDWPISAGLKGDNEYKKFFEWAKHMKNYHPDIKDVAFQLLHCNPIRYQTKLYDERVNTFSIFSEEEQEFLQFYRWLRQWPEFFQPKELFSEMEDNTAQEVAEKLLQSFEIQNDKIRCTDPGAIQAMIPYVKRLVQLFPEIREKTKRALLPDEIRIRVYQFETRCYVEKINQSPLEFKSDASNFREFLESEEQKILNLRMVKGDEWTGLIKVYQVLQKTGYLIEGQYSILKLKRFLTLNKFMDIRKLMQSTVTPYLLILACEDNQQLDEETRDLIRTLFDTFEQKPNIKIIFITRSEGSIVTFLHFLSRRISGKGFVRRVEELTWSDLTASSQEKLLEKSVIFQGAKISLNKLMSAESPAAIFLHLGALLEEKELMIADPVPISNGYNEGFYVGRTLRHQTAIKQDIFNDKDVRDSPVYLASTEEQYTKLCQLHPTSNVHWVEKDKSEKLVWQQSQGSLEILRRYIDTESSHTYTADDLDKLIEQAQHQRFMLISDTAGMGKSTVLTHLSQQIKQNFPSKWVVRIDLNDHTDALKALKQEEINKEKSIEFVLEKFLKLKPCLEVELFKQCCEQKQNVGIIIMLDGFDEISPNYKENVIGLLQALRQTAVEQLWVTTRPHLRNELEDNLQQLSYTLEPFSEKDQVEFLTKFWCLQDWFSETKGKEKDIETNKLEIYAEHLIKKLAQSVSDKDKEFTGIPLQTRMLAEAFDKEVKIYYESAESMPDLSFKLDLLELYGRFIERKYDIYQEEKFRVRADNVVAVEQRERDLESMRGDHQLLALKLLFNEKQVAVIRSNEECAFSAEGLARIGIAQINSEGKPQFIHRTFSEYYVADSLLNHLTEWNNSSEEIQTFVLKCILQEEECRVIRVFIDALLSSSKPSDEVLKHYGNRIHDLGIEYILMLHKAAVEGNVYIMGFLLDSLQAAAGAIRFINSLRDTFPPLPFYRSAGPSMSTDMPATFLHFKLAICPMPRKKRVGLPDFPKITILDCPGQLERTARNLSKESLFRQYGAREIIWHVATRRGKLHVLQEIWEWAKENLTREEIKNKLLLAKDTAGMTAWHEAVRSGNLEILKKIWEWAEEKLTTEEINNKLLLATDIEGMTAWHEAVWSGNLEILKKIWEWAEEKLTTEEINKKLLLATDNQGMTAWYFAACEGNRDVMLNVWEWAEEKLTREEINNKLLLATDNDGMTAWQKAVLIGNLETLKNIWELAKENLTTEEINNKFLLATDYEGRTVWHVTAEDHMSVISLRKRETNNGMLSGKYKFVLHFHSTDAKGGKLDVLQKIWELAKENLTKEEINNKLLLATDKSGKNILHILTRGAGSLHVLLKIWEWAEEELTTEEIKKLLLATDNRGKTPWHYAAYLWNREILQKLWEWVEEKLAKQEINNMLLLAVNNEGITAWHEAVRNGNLETLKNIWEWAKGKLTTEEINNKLLFATDIQGKTAWHKAVRSGNLEILKKIWEWAEEKLTTEEINNKLLLATDNEGMTAWHEAVRSGNLEILKKVWEKAEEKLTKDEINNTFLLATDMEGMTAWHEAVRSGNLEVLKKIWEWAEEKLTKEEINNKLLLATDKMGKNILHIVTGRGFLHVLLKIWEWAKKNLTTEEINNKLLLATDDEGRTAWHMTAKNN